MNKMYLDYLSVDVNSKNLHCPHRHTASSGLGSSSLSRGSDWLWGWGLDSGSDGNGSSISLIDNFILNRLLKYPPFV